MVLLMFYFLSVAIYSQEAGNLNISLKEAIDLGLKNRYDVKANKYNVTAAQNRISKSKKEWIPDISGSGNMRYSPQIQSTYIPGGFFGPNPALVSLGAKSTSIFGLDLNQNVFRPAIITDTKIAKNNLKLEKERNIEAENNIKEQIALSYLNVLLKKLQHKIATEDEQRYKEYSEVAEGKVRSGTLIENDYLKAKLDYENSKVETLKAKQNYDLAVSNVKYVINVPSETRLFFTDSINSNNITVDQIPAKDETANRTEIKQLMIQQRGNKLEISKNRQNALPTVAVFANYSKQFLYNNFDYTLNQWWSPFNYLGLRLSLPITSNFKNYNTIQESKIKTLQTDLDLKQKTADIFYEIQKSYTELNNALQNVQTTKKNYDLSKIIYENQKQQYNLGTLLYSNLLDTDKSLNTTEQNYIKAVYDYLLATINYKKAIGNY